MNQVNLVGMAERDIFRPQCARVAELAFIEEPLQAGEIDRGRRSGFFLRRSTHRAYCFRNRGSRTSTAAILRRQSADLYNEVSERGNQVRRQPERAPDDRHISARSAPSMDQEPACARGA